MNTKETLFQYLLKVKLFQTMASLLTLNTFNTSFIVLSVSLLTLNK